jgi:hypothetical protein
MIERREYGVSERGGRQGSSQRVEAFARFSADRKPAPGMALAAAENSALTCHSGGLSAIAIADIGLAGNYGLIESAHQAGMYQLAQHIPKSRMPAKAVVTSTFSRRGPKCVSRSIC